MCKAVQWEPFTNIVRRITLKWLGHVARMHKDRRPKQVLFGWWKDHRRLAHGSKFEQTRWISHILEQAQISPVDWFRLARDRAGWKRKIWETFPPIKMCKQQEKISISGNQVFLCQCNQKKDQKAIMKNPRQGRKDGEEIRQNQKSAQYNDKTA